MLYDPKRERYPEFYKFIAWLRTKPTEERYLWSNHSKCACGQFWAGDANWFALNAKVRRTEGVDFNQLAYGNESYLDWSFGKLLERAEAKLAELA